MRFCPTCAGTLDLLRPEGDDRDRHVCPACGTVFRVVQDQLRVSQGWVRCGRCAEAFNAMETMVDWPATQLAESLPEVHRLLLWQPVVSGKTYWTQFLRIRIAAEMSQADGVKSTEELRQWSARGDIVEVSGFEVGAALAQRLDTLSLPGGALPPGLQVDWFEVLADADAEREQRVVKHGVEGSGRGRQRIRQGDNHQRDGQQAELVIINNARQHGLLAHRADLHQHPPLAIDRAACQAGTRLLRHR